jgi:adenylate cyclase
MKKWLNTITLSIILTAVSLVIFTLDLPLIELFELKSYDFKVRVRGERPISNKVVIVAIDEKSLKKEGRWPWPRVKMGQLVDNLSKGGTSVIGFDIFFPEREQNISPQRFAKGVREADLGQKSPNELVDWYSSLNDSDLKFATAIEKSERTVLGYFIYELENLSNADSSELTQEHLEQLDFSQFSVVQRYHEPDVSLPLRSIGGVGMSLPKLMTAANSAGFVSFVPQMDGVVRWVPTIMQYKEYIFPPLSLQMAREATRLPLAAKLYPFGVDQILLGENIIPTSANGDFLVNYFGPAYTFAYLSATDVLSGKIGQDQLKNKIVLIGGTAAGTHDIHTSPFGPLYPGVEVHANIIESLLQGDFVTRPEWIHALDLAMILVSGILLGIVSRYYKAYGAALCLVFGLLGYLAVDFYLFTAKGYWINTVYPLFTQIFVYSGITLYQYGFEQKEKKFIKGAFSQYLAPAVVNQLVENPKLLKLGGERKEVTAFFSDVAGFSSISEKMEPEPLVKLLNYYLTEMTDILKKYEGTVDKFEGDAIIAFFGAPIAFKDHASRTCLAAVEMQERLQQMRVQWKVEGQPELFMRIGINTGPVVVGNMGSMTRMDYTMMGDSVNLAARLEGVGKQYKTETTVSEFTYEQAKEVIEVRELDMIRVVGKQQPIKIFEIMGKKGELDGKTREKLSHFNEGYEFYKQKQWNEGADCFYKALQIDEDDGPSLTYFERCITFQVHPPEKDWDGVFSMGTK